MTSLETPAAGLGLVDAIQTKLRNAPAPFKLRDVAKGLPRPKKTKAPDFQNEVRAILDEQARIGNVFRHPSGKGGEDRYWSRDEKHLFRVKAAELAVQPQPLSALKTKLGKEVKGTDAAFVESVLRELIDEDRLFEHPPKSKRAGPLFGSSPPPPPLPTLEQPKHKKAVDKLIGQCRKLLAAAGVPAEELLRLLRTQVVGSGSPEPPAESHPAVVGDSFNPSLEDLILRAVSDAPVVSLADLRREMPSEFRGRAFDDAVIHLAEERRVVLSQDADPSSFSESERSEYVQDGRAVYTTIAKWD